MLSQVTCTNKENCQNASSCQLKMQYEILAISFADVIAIEMLDVAYDKYIQYLNKCLYLLTQIIITTIHLLLFSPRNPVNFLIMCCFPIQCDINEYNPCSPYRKDELAACL